MIERVHAYKHEEIAELQRREPESALRAAIDSADAPRGFRARLEHDSHGSGLALVAEIKKSSPSAGRIRDVFDPAQIARDFRARGASCLSVLTDRRSFEGDIDHVRAVRRAVDLPVLAKDFYLDEHQVLRARAGGADCVIVILALVDDETAHRIERTALGLGMDVLVEVHDAAELARALRMRSRLLGINNRNLTTLRTSLRTAEELATGIPAGYTLLGESGLARRADLDRLAEVGVRSFLVGESLLRSTDIRLATERLLTPGPVTSGDPVHE
ncbi:indole-3-glycerol phosphate synthase TrpC [Pseudonocardia sp. HH130630-07]|uniref:indole-3-glycerol phosphate synthase TrpC n=1 Tax=Pseudonocardia sp. HH130630-07 TaxID=1690815 RepID=UPI000815248F|nr:indole-3-glycerol phosphate synthase TrpC [Pseudonocardia sp. HH130630-07]ANY08056.1 hypothetical protein AFB00_19140 [Pseudonocardia sp. HH130630-07]